LASRWGLFGIELEVWNVLGSISVRFGVDLASLRDRFGIDLAVWNRCGSVWDQKQIKSDWRQIFSVHYHGM